MSEASESAARAIAVTLKELMRISEEGGLPMLSYMLGTALTEAKAQAKCAASEPTNVIPFPPAP